MVGRSQCIDILFFREVIETGIMMKDIHVIEKEVVLRENLREKRLHLQLIS